MRGRQFHNLTYRSTYYLFYGFRPSHLLTPSPELATCGLGEGEEEEGEYRSTYYLFYGYRPSHLLTPSPELATCGLGEGEEEEGETQFHNLINRSSYYLIMVLGQATC